MGSKSKQAAARLGDIDTGHPPSPPTPIITGSTNVLTNGRPAARKGDKLVPHHPGIRTITEGSASVLINGKKAARVSDGINCGGKIIIGSGNVLIGDKPEAPRNAKLEMEFDELMDESFKPEFQNLTPHQQAEVAANIAVKYRKQEGGISTWHEHYLSNDPAPGELIDPLKQKGYQRAQNEKAKDAKEMLGDTSNSEYSSEREGSVSKNGKTPPPTKEEVELAKEPGGSDEQIAAREKTARNYLENNGFTEKQILSAVGSKNGLVKGGVDLTQPVEIVSFPPPDTMTQYVKSHGNPGNWFDPTSTQTADAMGINSETRTKKDFQMQEGSGLLSFAKPILDNWTVPENPVQTTGGGRQLLVNDVIRKSAIG